MIERRPWRSGPLDPADAARIAVTYRCLARGLQLAENRREQKSGWRSVALGAAAAGDLLLWRALRKDALPLSARVGIDLADLALWAGPGGAELVTALTPHVALDVETGVAGGVRGFLFPLAAAAVANGVRVAYGRTPDFAQNVPHAGAVIGGITLRRGEVTRMARAHAVHADELTAKAVRAFLAGQQDIAMGASSIIDQLKPVAMLLGSDSAGSTLNQVRAGWKDSLAEQARQHAVFLDSAVRMWRDLHNDHPDLAGYVDIVDIAEGDGTVLLTGRQASQLADLLERRGLSGSLRFEMSPKAGARSVRPGRAFDILVNNDVITVPSDPSAPVDRFNPAPPALLFGAWAALMPTRHGEGDLPMPLALACAAAYLAAAVAFFGKPPEEAARRALWTGLALSGFQGAVCALGCTSDRNDGNRQLFSGTFGIAPAGLLLAASRRHLTRRDELGALGAFGAIAALAFALADAPRSKADFAIALAHPLAAMIGMDVYAQAAGRQTDALSAELRVEDDRVETESFENGRLHVLQLAVAALEEAEQSFSERTDLDADVRDSVAARLESIRALAADLGVTRPSGAS